VAITSRNYYNDVVPGADAARLFTLASARRFWCEDQNAVKVSRVVGGTRQIKIAPGRFGAWGISNYNDSEVTLQLPNPSSGTQWHLAYAEHVWADGASATTFKTEPCGTTATKPGAYEVTPGDTVWQPLAYVPITAGDSDPGLPVDLRVQGTAAGSAAITSEMALPYYEFLGEELWLGKTRYSRILNAAGTAQEWLIDKGPYGRNAINPAPSSWGTSYTGWTTTALNSRMIRDGNSVELDLRITRVGASLSVGPDGHIADVKMIKLNQEWWPSHVTYSGGCSYIGPDNRNYAGLCNINEEGDVSFIAGTGTKAIAQKSIGAWSVSATFRYTQQGA
jgi:hypothetical protein